MLSYDIAGLIAPFFEGIIFFLMFEAFLERKRTVSPLSYVFAYLVLVALIGVCNHYLIYTFANIIAISMAAFAISSALYTGSFWKKLMTVFATCVMSGVMELMGVYLSSLLFRYPVAMLLQDLEYRFFSLLTAKILAIMACNVIRVRMKHRYFEMAKSYWILFGFLFAGSYYAVFLIGRMSLEINDPVIVVMSAIGALVLFFNTFLALYLYERLAVQGEALRFREQYAQQLKYQVRHLDDLLARQAELRRVKHDMANQLLALKGYLNAGDIAGGQAYVDNLLETLDAISPSVHTGNTALDAILSTKKVLAESRGIAFHLDVQVPEQLGLAPVDQCIIFGNALDNALEACARAGDDDPVIALTLRQKGAKLLCKIVNTAPPLTDLTTHKADKEAHGFGLRNITDTLAKYGSEPIIEQKDGQFILKFVIFVEDQH